MINMRDAPAGNVVTGVATSGQGKIIIRLYRETVSEVMQKLRLDLGLTDKELDTHTIKPSVYAHLRTLVMFG